MRKVAANKVFCPVTGEILSRSLVEISDNGTVAGVVPLEREVNSAEWYAGIIVLSPVPVERVGEGSECFSEFAARLITSSARRETESCEVYLISPFDTFRMEFMPSSRIVRLR